jgi:hypothetical protein
MHKVSNIKEFKEKYGTLGASEIIEVISQNYVPEAKHQTKMCLEQLALDLKAIF